MTQRARETESAPGLWSLAGWPRGARGVVHGISSLGDMSLWGGSATGTVVPRWLELRDRLGFRGIVHARQVHGAHIHVHDSVPDGLLIVGDADGHATSQHGVLLAVSVADCVPVFVVDGEGSAMALLHGGWRGVAADIVERGIALLASRYGVGPDRLQLHCGPAICGDCYEVGPEVPAALGLPGAEGPSHVDVRGVIAARAVAAGLAPENVSVSEWCTRHGQSPFFSHRAGCAERQVAVLGFESRT